MAKRTTKTKPKTKSQHQSELSRFAKKEVAKRRKKTYKQRRVLGTDKEIDRAISAELPGWRISASGNEYFENRENRSDTAKERRYHGSVKNGKLQKRKSKPGTRTGKTASRSTHAKTTTRRVTSYRKHDTQKSHIFAKIIQRAERSTGRLTFYEPTKTKKLSQTELNKIAVGEMKKIHCEKIEHLVIIDRFGNILCRGKGGIRSVRIPDQSFFDKYGNDLIMIHNHPGASWHRAPTPFSGQDLAMQRKYLIKDMRVCCRGYMYRCVIKDMATFRLSGRYKTLGDSAFLIASAKAADKVRRPEQTEDDTLQTYNAKVRKYEKDLDFATVQFAHEEYRKSLNTGRGLSYTRRIFTKEGLIKND